MTKTTERTRRVLLRVTSTSRADYAHLVGTLVIGYPRGHTLAKALRLSAPDPLLGQRRYIALVDVVTEYVRDTAYDDYRVRAAGEARA